MAKKKPVEVKSYRRGLPTKKPPKSYGDKLEDAAKKMDGIMGIGKKSKR